MEARVGMEEVEERVSEDLQGPLTHRAVEASREAEAETEGSGVEMETLDPVEMGGMDASDLLVLMEPAEQGLANGLIVLGYQAMDRQAALGGPEVGAEAEAGVEERTARRLGTVFIVVQVAEAEGVEVEVMEEQEALVGSAGGHHLRSSSIGRPSA